jgi:hypothetical protein
MASLHFNGNAKPIPMFRLFRGDEGRADGNHTRRDTAAKTANYSAIFSDETLFQRGTSLRAQGAMHCRDCSW